MSEGTYEYECMRAELLGLEKPSYEEFLKKHPVQENNEETVEIESLKVADLENEKMTNVSGGLDELNNILSATQKKINRFKATCGSLTNLLKIRVGHGSNDSLNKQEVEVVPDEISASTTTDENKLIETTTERKSDLTKALDNHVDRLDSLIEKAENAQYSMKHQNKQMKGFLK